ncbi:MAG: hypothetical protein HYZ75_07165 [Elusimicrobia bacterium]|nr:hypothetical protein [Elusimicrobiota bacterium]
MRPLRRLVRKADRWDFMLILLVLVAVMELIRFTSRPEKPPETVESPKSTSPHGMDELWLEAALGKKDMRPVPDPLIVWKEPVVEEPKVRQAVQVQSEPEPAAEEEPYFPTPAPAPEPRPAPERPRIAPMAESFLGSSGGRAASSAFLDSPKPARQPARAAAQPAPPPAPPAPPRSRTRRALAGH